MDHAELRPRPASFLPALLAGLAALSCTLPKPNEEPAPSTKPTPEATGPPPPSPSSDISFRCMGQRTPVIMYHDIVETRGPGTVWFDCTVDEFKVQMKLIQDRGYKPVSLDELYDHLLNGTPLPDKAMVLTFDDNYQGFHDYAWPILKADNFPATMFVHSGFVGKTTGKAHMSWDTLRELLKDPLFTVGSHTITHPDLTKLDPAAVTSELEGSKSELENELGVKIKYFAYPDGYNDAQTQALVRQAGYLMAFSIENGPAEESPNIVDVNRTIQTRLPRALDECERDLPGIGTVYEGPVKDAPVAYKEQTIGQFHLAMVQGGRAVSILSTTREMVPDFMKRTAAVAGINGTFFDMAAIKATDNKMVGPCKAADQDALIPDLETWRAKRLANRPMIMWGPTQLAVVPYNPGRMNDPEAYREFMPDMTDAFLGGALLVDHGKALSLEAMKLFASSDIEDPRRRAAFGTLADGTMMAAASKDSVPSSEFAKMLEAAGVEEAVLLDSGFSTSLVYGDKIMASGHSSPGMPSRPVPHAIVFEGSLDPGSKAAADAAIPATDMAALTANPNGEPPQRRRHHRRRRRRRTQAPAPAPESPTAGPPPSDVPPPP